MLKFNNPEEKMISPCGMNCTYCYAHLKRKKPCLGCRNSDDSKPEHCKKCKIKNCINEKQILSCCECSEYPCILIKRLDKSYRKRYKESLINNFKIINEKGIEYYLESEKDRLKCPECGGPLDIHHKRCAQCDKTFEVHK